MTIKKSCIIAAVVTTIGMASAAEESKASGFDLTGNIQTQAYKAFYDNEKENTLDNFWFRANIGGTYSSEDFDAKVTIRMYAQVSGRYLLRKLQVGNFRTELETGSLEDGYGRCR